MGEFPSGQRGQTVNLLRIASMVRIRPPPPEKNGNRDTITVLFSYIRLRRVILLRSYIWLTPSYIALRAVLEANIISLPQTAISLLRSKNITPAKPEYNLKLRLDPPDADCLYQHHKNKTITNQCRDRLHPVTFCFTNTE